MSINFWNKESYISEIINSIYNKNYKDEFDLNLNDGFEINSRKLKLDNFLYFLDNLNIKSKCIKGAPFNIAHHLDDIYPNLYHESSYNIENYGNSLYTGFEDKNYIQNTLQRNRIEVKWTFQINWNLNNEIPNEIDNILLNKEDLILLINQINTSENGIYFIDDNRILIPKIIDKNNLSIKWNDKLYYLQPEKNKLNNRGNDYYDWSFDNSFTFKEGDDYLIRNEFDYLLKPLIDINHNLTLEDGSMIACGEFGTILIWDNFESCDSDKFKLIRTYTNKNLNKLFKINNYIYCIGDEGIILKSYNNGNNWDKLTINTENKLNDIYFIDKFTGFVVGDNGTIFYTLDEGLNWIPINFTEEYPILIRNLTCIKIIKDSRGYNVWIGSAGGILIQLFRSDKIDKFKLVKIWKPLLEDGDGELFSSYDENEVLNFDINEIKISTKYENNQEIKIIYLLCSNGIIIYSSRINDNLNPIFTFYNFYNNILKNVNNNPLFINPNKLNLKGWISMIKTEENNLFYDILWSDNYLFWISYDDKSLDKFNITNVDFLDNYQIIEDKLIYNINTDKIEFFSLEFNEKINSIAPFDIKIDNDTSKLFYLVGNNNLINIFSLYDDLSNRNKFNLTSLNDYSCEYNFCITKIENTTYQNENIIINDSLSNECINDKIIYIYFQNTDIIINNLLLGLKPKLLILDYFIGRKLYPLEIPELTIPFQLNDGGDIIFKNENISIRNINNASSNILYDGSNAEMPNILGFHQYGNLIGIRLNPNLEENKLFISYIRENDYLEIHLEFTDFLYPFINRNNFFNPNVIDLNGESINPYFEPKDDYQIYLFRDTLKVQFIDINNLTIYFENWNNTSIIDKWNELINRDVIHYPLLNPDIIYYTENPEKGWIDIFNTNGLFGEVNNLVLLDGILNKDNIYHAKGEKDLHWEGKYRKSILQILKFNMWNRNLINGTEDELKLNNHPLLGNNYIFNIKNNELSIKGKITYQNIYKNIENRVKINDIDYDIKYSKYNYYTPSYNLLNYLNKINSIFTSDYKFISYSKEYGNPYILKDINLLNKAVIGNDEIKIYDNILETTYNEVKDLIPYTFIKFYTNWNNDIREDKAIQTLFLLKIERIDNTDCPKTWKLYFDRSIDTSLNNFSIYLRSNLSLGEISSLLEETDDVYYKERIKIITNGYAKIISNDFNIRENISALLFTNENRYVDLLIFNLNDNNIYFNPLELWNLGLDNIAKNPKYLKESYTKINNYAEKVFIDNYGNIEKLKSNGNDIFFINNGVFYKNYKPLIFNNIQKEYEEQYGNDDLKFYLQIPSNTPIPNTILNLYNQSPKFNLLNYANNTPLVNYVNGYNSTSIINDYYIDKQNRIWIATDVGLFVYKIDGNNVIYDSNIIKNIFNSGRENLNNEWGNFYKLKFYNDLLWVSWEITNWDDQNNRFGWINLSEMNYYELDGNYNSSVIWNNTKPTDINSDGNKIEDFSVLSINGGYLISLNIFNNVSSRIYYVYFDTINENLYLINNLGGCVLNPNNTKEIYINLSYNYNNGIDIIDNQNKSGRVNYLSEPISGDGKLNTLEWIQNKSENWLNVGSFIGNNGGISLYELYDFEFNTYITTGLIFEILNYNKNENKTFIKINQSLDTKIYEKMKNYFVNQIENNFKFELIFYTNKGIYSFPLLSYDNKGSFEKDKTLIFEDNLLSKWNLIEGDKLIVSKILFNYADFIIRNYTYKNKLIGINMKDYKINYDDNLFLSEWGIENLIELANFNPINPDLDNFSYITNQKELLSFVYNNNKLYTNDNKSIYEQKDLIQVQILQNKSVRTFTLTDGLNFSKIENDYSWILSAIIEDAVIGVNQDGKLIWYKGKWICGNWKDGIWYSGEWINGTWEAGEWYSVLVQNKDNIWIANLNEYNPNYSKWFNGLFLGGKWNGGKWFNGYFRGNINSDGVWQKAIWNRGLWYNGQFGIQFSYGIDNSTLNFYSDKTQWNDGEWYGGIFHNGNWINGIMNSYNYNTIFKWGYFRGGEFQNGIWENGFLSQTTSVKTEFGTKSTKWKPSIWKNGIFQSGNLWANKKWELGYNEHHQNTIWYSGVFEMGNWYGGTFYFGQWKNGNWEAGVWKGYIDINPNTDMWLDNFQTVYNNELTIQNKAYLVFNLPEWANFEWINQIWIGGELNWNNVQLTDYEYWVLDKKYLEEGIKTPNYDACNLITQVESLTQLSQIELNDLETAVFDGNIQDLIGDVQVLDTSQFNEDFLKIYYQSPQLNIKNYNTIYKNIFNTELSINNQNLTIETNINNSNLVFDNIEIDVNELLNVELNNVLEEIQTTNLSTSSTNIINYISEGRLDLVEEELINEIETRSLNNEVYENGKKYRELYWVKRLNMGGKLPFNEPIPDNARNSFNPITGLNERNPFNSDIDLFDSNKINYNSVYKLKNFPTPPYAPIYDKFHERIYWSDLMSSLGYDFDDKINTSYKSFYQKWREQNIDYWDYIKERENNSIDNPNLLSIDYLLDENNKYSFLDLKRKIMGDIYLNPSEIAIIRAKWERYKEMIDCCVKLDKKEYELDIDRPSLRSQFSTIRIYAPFENGAFNSGIWENGIKLNGNHNGGWVKKIFMKGGKFN